MSYNNTSSSYISVHAGDPNLSGDINSSLLESRFNTFWGAITFGPSDSLYVFQGGIERDGQKTAIIKCIKNNIVQDLDITFNNESDRKTFKQLYTQVDLCMANDRLIVTAANSGLGLFIGAIILDPTDPAKGVFQRYSLSSLASVESQFVFLHKFLYDVTSDRLYFTYKNINQRKFTLASINRTGTSAIIEIPDIEKTTNNEILPTYISPHAILVKSQTGLHDNKIFISYGNGYNVNIICDLNTKTIEKVTTDITNSFYLLTNNLTYDSPIVVGYDKIRDEFILRIYNTMLIMVPGHSVFTNKTIALSLAKTISGKPYSTFAKNKQSAQGSELTAEHGVPLTVFHNNHSTSTNKSSLFVGNMEMFRTCIQKIDLEGGPALSVLKPTNDQTVPNTMSEYVSGLTRGMNDNVLYDLRNGTIGIQGTLSPTGGDYDFYYLSNIDFNYPYYEAKVYVSLGIDSPTPHSGIEIIGLLGTSYYKSHIRLENIKPGEELNRSFVLQTDNRSERYPTPLPIIGLMVRSVDPNNLPGSVALNYYIEILGRAPQPTPTNTPTFIPSPTPTPTPVLTNYPPQLIRCGLERIQKTNYSTDVARIDTQILYPLSNCDLYYLEQHLTGALDNLVGPLSVPNPRVIVLDAYAAAPLSQMLPYGTKSSLGSAIIKFITADNPQRIIWASGTIIVEKQEYDITYKCGMNKYTLRFILETGLAWKGGGSVPAEEFCPVGKTLTREQRGFTSSAIPGIHMDFSNTVQKTVIEAAPVVLPTPTPTSVSNFNKNYCTISTVCVSVGDSQKPGTIVRDNLSRSGLGLMGVVGSGHYQFYVQTSPTDKDLVVDYYVNLSTGANMFLFLRKDSLGRYYWQYRNELQTAKFSTPLCSTVLPFTVRINNSSKSITVLNGSCPPQPTPTKTPTQTRTPTRRPIIPTPTPTRTPTAAARVYPCRETLFNPPGATLKGHINILNVFGNSTTAFDQTIVNIPGDRFYEPGTYVIVYGGGAYLKDNRWHIAPRNMLISAQAGAGSNTYNSIAIPAPQNNYVDAYSAEKYMCGWKSSTFIHLGGTIDLVWQNYVPTITSGHKQGTDTTAINNNGSRENPAYYLYRVSLAPQPSPTPTPTRAAIISPYVFTNNTVTEIGMHNRTIVLNTASGEVTLTLTNTVPPGTEMRILRLGANAAKVTSAPGVTISPIGVSTSVSNLYATNSFMWAVYYGSNNWLIYGDVQPL